MNRPTKTIEMVKAIQTDKPGATDVLVAYIEQLETEMERRTILLHEAAWYVDHYGDSRKDRHFYERFLAAANGEPEPAEDE